MSELYVEPSQVTYAKGYVIDEFRDIEQHDMLPKELVAKIGACILEAFGRPKNSEDMSRKIHGDQLLAVYPDASRERVIAFGAADIMSPQQKFDDAFLSDEVGCYFAAATISPEFQGRGIYQTLNAQRLEFAADALLDTLFTQTQNPRVQEGITHTIRRLEPVTGVSIRSIDRVLRPGAYGRMLTDVRPYARSLSYDDIDYERGDAAVVTWRLDYANYNGMRDGSSSEKSAVSTEA